MEGKELADSEPLSLSQITGRGLIYILLLGCIFSQLAVITLGNEKKLFKTEIETSRERENLLLTQIKLLSYQVDVLTNSKIDNGNL